MAFFVFSFVILLSYFTFCYVLVFDISAFFASYVGNSKHLEANIRALEKMAGGVKTGFAILSLLTGKLTLDISWSSKETNFKSVDIIFALWVVSVSNRQCYKEL